MPSGPFHQSRSPEFQGIVCQGLGGIAMPCHSGVPLLQAGVAAKYLSTQPADIKQDDLLKWFEET